MRRSALSSVKTGTRRDVLSSHRLMCSSSFLIYPQDIVETEVSLWIEEELVRHKQCCCSHFPHLMTAKVAVIKFCTLLEKHTNLISHRADVVPLCRDYWVTKTRVPVSPSCEFTLPKIFCWYYVGHTFSMI